MYNARRRYDDTNCPWETRHLRRYTSRFVRLPTCDMTRRAARTRLVDFPLQSTVPEHGVAHLSVFVTESLVRRGSARAAQPPLPLIQFPSDSRRILCGNKMSPCALELLTSKLWRIPRCTCPFKRQFLLMPSSRQHKLGFTDLKIQRVRQLPAAIARSSDPPRADANQNSGWRKHNLERSTRDKGSGHLSWRLCGVP
ncbi:hypothetical protein EVAR_66170_1 [Eumeta japonica]|uniref:Uncharacterized protein n=1 Tax=Eumeta variegata TaxID=151549 RepID=A0A4C1ZPH7_EUMVA|nr:hypothetical protein EVAR_66170_1 [Eumeta japonica]